MAASSCRNGSIQSNQLQRCYDMGGDRVPTFISFTSVRIRSLSEHCVFRAIACRSAQCIQIRARIKGGTITHLFSSLITSTHSALETRRKAIEIERAQVSDNQFRVIRTIEVAKSRMSGILWKRIELCGEQTFLCCC